MAADNSFVSEYLEDIREQLKQIESRQRSIFDQTTTHKADAEATLADVALASINSTGGGEETEELLKQLETALDNYYEDLSDANGALFRAVTKSDVLNESARKVRRVVEKLHEAQGGR